MTFLLISLAVMFALAGLAGRWASRKQRRLAGDGINLEPTEERHARDHR